MTYVHSVVLMATNSCHGNTIDMVKHEWHVDTVSLNILKTAHLHLYRPLHIITVAMDYGYTNGCHGYRYTNSCHGYGHTNDCHGYTHTHTIPLPASVVPLLVVQLLSPLGSVSQYQ